MPPQTPAHRWRRTRPPLCMSTSNARPKTAPRIFQYGRSTDPLHPLMARPPSPKVLSRWPAVVDTAEGVGVTGVGVTGVGVTGVGVPLACEDGEGVALEDEVPPAAVIVRFESPRRMYAARPTTAATSSPMVTPSTTPRRGREDVPSSTTARRLAPSLPLALTPHPRRGGRGSPHSGRPLPRPHPAARFRESPSSRLAGSRTSPSRSRSCLRAIGTPPARDTGSVVTPDALGVVRNLPAAGPESRA